jgi:hypothetical protein
MHRNIVLLTALTLSLAAPAAAQSGVPFGKLAGTVVDPAGIPQMGASIAVLAEGVAQASPLRLLTNDRGAFAAEKLRPGLYTVRVTLAGFLPAVERSIRVDADLTTLLKIEVGNLFSSFQVLRRVPGAERPDPDEWAWVLRSSSSTRSVLRFDDGQFVLASGPAGEGGTHRPLARVEVTAGARRRGSVSNVADAPSSAVAYDQKIGPGGRMLFAGQASYERAAAAGFATMWLPSGELGGPGGETTLVLRQSQLGPGGLTFRGARFEHNNRMDISSRLNVEYGADYILAGLGSSTASLRPNVQVNYALSPHLRASLSVTSRPWAHAHGESNPLQSVLEEMDAFPALLMRHGRAVLEGGWHQEIGVERRLSANASLSAAAFRDRSRHTAVFGRGPAGSDFMQDFYSDAFAYDGGESCSTGARVSYRQRLADGTDVVLLYSWAGALVPGEMTDTLALRDALDTQGRHSVAARVSRRFQWGTELSASYKWLSGPVVSRQDAFGEVAYQVDPFLNFSVRQPLPTFFFAGKLEALADFRNLLAQGYVPVSTADGQVVLIPAFRSFRGGFSFQF